MSITEKLAGRRVIASVSGGKDSAALSLHLRESGIEHDRVFMDTGWEHPETYAYLRGELTRVLGPITEIRGPLQMEELILKKAMFPSRKRRFCTQELKVRPMAKHLRSLGSDVVNAVGIRGSESEARSKLFEWEWTEDFGCETWRPLMTWSEADVIAIHARHGLRPNPLYLKGATRVGCWPCIYARKAEIRMVAETDPARIDRLRELEEKVSAGAGEQRGWFQAKTEEDGGFPPWPIDKVVEWSKTAHGGRQFELFAPDREPGCFRWGLCDTDLGDDSAVHAVR